MKKVAVISITKSGDEIMDAILQYGHYEYIAYSSERSKKEKISNITRDIFDSVDAIVFICSLGIVCACYRAFHKIKNN